MTRLISFYDGLGIAGSTLCLIHCLLLPLAIGLVPMLGTLASESVHEWLALALAAPALLAAHSGHRRHGRGELAALFALGACLLLWSAWLAEEETETVFTLAGGALLISAHAINRHLCKRCPQCQRGALPADGQ